MDNKTPVENAIRFPYKDKNYSLYFTRRSIVRLIDEGFDVVGYLDKNDYGNLSDFMKIYDASFYANHSDSTQEERDAILDEIFADLEAKLHAELHLLLMLTYLSHFSNNDGDEKNAPKWTAPTEEALLKMIPKNMMEHPQN